MQYTLPKDGTISDMFYDAQDRVYGSVHVTCRCGVLHYAVESKFVYDDDEIPTEHESVKHHHDCDSIGFFEFIGQVFVRECEGCSKYLNRYEEFIWNERDTIRNYLKIRVDQEKNWADQENVKNILAGIT